MSELYCSRKYRYKYYSFYYKVLKVSSKLYRCKFKLILKILKEYLNGFIKYTDFDQKALRANSNLYRM